MYQCCANSLVALAISWRNKAKQQLITGNNVYAHVPDINDFTKGLKAALKPNGTITLEFPHLMRQLSIRNSTPSTMNISYLSLYTVSRILKQQAYASGMLKNYLPMEVACGFLAAIQMIRKRRPNLLLKFCEKSSIKA